MGQDAHGILNKKMKKNIDYNWLAVAPLQSMAWIGMTEKKHKTI